MKYGIFINYRRVDKYFAGRIYDYLKSKGFDPFMDVYSLTQGRYTEDLQSQISATPYFLMVLTKDSLVNLRPDDERDTYYHEIKTAFESNRKLLLVADFNFTFTNVKLPKEIENLKNYNYYTISENMSNFYEEMERLCKTDIDLKELIGVLNWREYLNRNSNVFLSPRYYLEENIASLENRFGKELIESINKKVPFSGENRVKQINMSCYAASLIFAYERHFVDHRAFDFGTMFNIINELLKDDDFSFSLITNSPYSPAAEDAIKYNKLGNSSLEDNQRMVFLSSFANISKLITIEPYKSAWKEKRFQYRLTDAVLPFSYFQIIYKKPWEEFNHIKIDLYTDGLDSNVERKSIVVFEKDHKDIYLFLQNQNNYLKEKSIRANRDYFERNKKWVEEWDAYTKEFEGDD